MSLIIKRCSYSASDKLAIIDYALIESQANAAFKFGIHKSMVSRWVRDFRKIQKANPGNRRIGSGRHKKARLMVVGIDSEVESDGNDTLVMETAGLNDVVLKTLDVEHIP